MAKGVFGCMKSES